MTLCYLVVGLLLVVGAIIFNEMNRLALHTIIYRLDFRHWPVSLGIAFWLFFVWLIIDTISYGDTGSVSADVAVSQKQFRKRTKGVQRIVLVVCFYFLAASFISFRELGLRLYFSFLMPFYFEPMTLFFYDCTLTKRLLLPPLMAATAICFLLYLNRHFKKEERNDTSNTEKSDF